MAMNWFNLFVTSLSNAVPAPIISSSCRNTFNNSFRFNKMQIIYLVPFPVIYEWIVFISCLSYVLPEEWLYGKSECEIDALDPELVERLATSLLFSCTAPSFTQCVRGTFALRPWDTNRLTDWQCFRFPFVTSYLDYWWNQMDQDWKVVILVLLTLWPQRMKV